MNIYVAITVELLIGFCGLFFLTKVLGKTHFSQITPFDFISALILGELLGNAVYDRETEIWQVLFATTLWGTLIFGISLMTQKFYGVRKLFEGEPSILIRQGQIKYKAMKKNKIDLSELQSLIRQKGFFSIREVEYAILEPNGEISVMPKQGYDTPKRSDLQLPEKTTRLPIAVILDGKVVYDNLQKAGLDEQWLMQELAAQDIPGVKQILFAEWIEQQPLYIVKYS
ncbi:DUF421 domain-containing protein [Paenibacillus tarimensis]